MVKVPELRSNPDLQRDCRLVSVDQECEGLFREAVQKIEEVYLDGTDEWIEENDPELSQEMKEAEDDLNGVWRKNIDGKSSVFEFKQALERYSEAVMKANERYKTAFLATKGTQVSSMRL